MTCNEFRDALEGALDARSGLPPAARHHAETCRDYGCRVAFEDFRLIGDAVRSLPRVESPELVDRVVAALAPVRAPHPRSSGPVARRAGARSTVLSLITVAGVLVAAFLGLRPRPEPTQIVKTQGPQPTSGPSTPPAAVADRTNVPAPETEPFIPLHLAARAPALMTDTVNGHFDRTAITGLPVVTPLMSAVTEQFRPMGQELKEWVEQFRTAPDKMMDSTQIGPPVRPIG